MAHDPANPRLHLTNQPPDAGGAPAPIPFPAPEEPRYEETDSRADALLIGLASRGDEIAFMTLYRRHSPFVMSIARRYCRDESEALDVMQETFVYLLKKLPDLRLTAKLTTFLFPAIKNIALTMKRKQRTVALSSDHDSPDRSDQPLAAPEIGPRPIERVVEDLPEGQRDVLLLRFVEDLSLREIAAALDIPVGTVKSRLHQAIQTLKQDPRTAELFDAAQGDGM